MIWSVVSKSEMESFAHSNPTFQDYSEALGHENITLVVVDDEDNLDFISKGDLILLRTASNKLLNTIKRKAIFSTAELPKTYELALNKKMLSGFLNQHGVMTPRQYVLSELPLKTTYFVKPISGGKDKGISENSICYTREEVLKQYYWVKENCGEEAIIEEYIAGSECTVACNVDRKGKIHLSAIEYDEGNKCWHKMYKKDSFNIKKIATRVCRCMNIRSHCRIDIRKDKFGKMFVIDVNLIPSLGKKSLMPLCFSLDGNKSYSETLWNIVRTAKIMF